MTLIQLLLLILYLILTVYSIFYLKHNEIEDLNENVFVILWIYISLLSIFTLIVELCKIVDWDYIII